MPGRTQNAFVIGSTANLPEALCRALNAREFQPMPTPGPQDWLSNHPEPGQTYEQFVNSRPDRPGGRRNRLYLQPLGDFSGSESPPLEQIREFAAAFFTLDVNVLPILDLAQSEIVRRQHPATGGLQLLTTSILRLLRQRLPRDAFALLGITMADLYPEPAWNFVFGEADTRYRVGVYSFARYDPRFYGHRAATDSRELMLRRSCKVLAHEIGHMFGIYHCIWYRCLMNGSNHIAEADARPLHLCPVDLHKLQWSIGFDVVERYRRLEKFAAQAGFEDEARWLNDQLRFITAGEVQ
jgi:archaemetzincin